MTTNKLICICGSAGAIDSIIKILKKLPADFYVPIVILIHLSESRYSHLQQMLAQVSSIHTVSPEDYDMIQANTIYVVPSMYHIQIEKDFTFSFSLDEPVNYSRPSADVLLETASNAYQDGLLSIILSGASQDGSTGSSKVVNSGGTVLIIDPDEAEVNVMPKAAIDILSKPHVLRLNEIIKYIIHFGGNADE